MGLNTLLGSLQPRLATTFRHLQVGRLALLRIQSGLQMLLRHLALLLLQLLLWQVQSSWVDPDTPARKGFTQALTPGDTREFELVGAAWDMDFPWFSSYGYPSQNRIFFRSFRMNLKSKEEHSMTETTRDGQQYTRMTVSLPNFVKHLFYLLHKNYDTPSHTMVPS